MAFIYSPGMNDKNANIFSTPNRYAALPVDRDSGESVFFPSNEKPVARDNQSQIDYFCARQYLLKQINYFIAFKNTSNQLTDTNDFSCKSTLTF